MKSTFKKVFIGCDHTAIDIKKEIIDFLDSNGIEVTDIGNSNDNKGVLFADIAEKVSKPVSKNGNYGGILICGNGVGMCIAANKIPNIRASVCNELFTVRYAKRDMHLNVLCLGARVIGSVLMKEIISVWLTQEKGEGRFQKRVDYLTDFEKNFLK